ncbi:ribosomal protein s21 domain-containing protein [Ditylenchus destructor]|nr:ribosomal protein s21 domain-containing protein [Ditylenchus destructor]
MPRFVFHTNLRQPFGIRFFKGIWAAHPDLFHRTILVKDNDVDGAFMLLNRLLKMEGMLDMIRNKDYYVKPTKQRWNISRTATKALISEDMDIKMRLLMRKNRRDPYPGQVTM